MTVFKSHIMWPVLNESSQIVHSTPSPDDDSRDDSSNKGGREETFRFI